MSLCWALKVLHGLMLIQERCCSLWWILKKLLSKYLCLKGLKQWFLSYYQLQGLQKTDNFFIRSFYYSNQNLLQLCVKESSNKCWQYFSCACFRDLFTALHEDLFWVQSEGMFRPCCSCIHGKSLNGLIVLLGTYNSTKSNKNIFKPLPIIFNRVLIRILRNQCVSSFPLRFYRCMLALW